MTHKRTSPSDTQALLARLQSGKSLQDCRQKQVIFAQGDPADAVFYILKGRVKMTEVSSRGKEAVLGILGPGQFFGEDCLVTGHPLRTFTATSMEESSLIRFQKVAVVRLLREDGEFASLFASHAVARAVRLEEDLIDQLFNSTEKRLARILLLLAHFGRDGEPQPVAPSINQETLAQMVGASRSRVSSFMNKFKKLGFIDYNGGLTVNSSLLRMLLHD
jgi:CRP/FNR family cyclic AMP-dependent transcriptional regulator